MRGDSFRRGSVVTVPLSASVICNLSSGEGRVCLAVGFAASCIEHMIALGLRHLSATSAMTIYEQEKNWPHFKKNAKAKGAARRKCKHNFNSLTSNREQ